MSKPAGGAGTILVCDDQVDSLKMLSTILGEAGYTVRATTDGELALRSALAAPPELVLLDVQMPGLDGFEVCRRLKADPRTAEIPVIFITWLERVGDKVLGFAAGGADYIPKPFEREEILARVAVHLSLYRFRVEQKERLRKETEERIHAEEEVERSEEFFRALAEASPMAIFTSLGPERRTEYTNPAFRRIFGYTMDEVPSVDEWWPLAYPDPKYRAEVSEEWSRRRARMTETGIPMEPMETEVTCRDGSRRHVAWGFASVGPRHVAFGLDLTDRKTAEVALKKMEHRAAHAERLATIARLGGGVAHEMNNVLAGISLAAQRGLIGMDDHAITDDRLDILRAILENVHAYTVRGASIVSAIRSLSMPVKPRETEPILLEEIFDRVLQLRAAELLSRKVRVEKSIATDAWVKADSSEIDQLLTNLLINAEHAMVPTGGGVLRIIVHRIEGQVEIRVEDTGIGMTEDVLKQAFLPFFSTKGAYAKDAHNIPGTGLGLAICARIVEENQGTITARSVPGEGSVFTVRLPESGPGDRDAVSPAGPAPSDALRPLRVLVVDDEESMARSLCDFITRSHPDTHYVTSARAALEHVARRRPDLILTDYIMPDMRADALLKELPPGITVVAITGWIDFENDEERQRIFGGFHRVIQKPYDLKTIQDLLREVANGRLEK